MKEPKHQSPYILKLIRDIMQKLQSCDLYPRTPVPLLDSLLSVATAIWQAIQRKVTLNPQSRPMSILHLGNERQFFHWNSIYTAKELLSGARTTNPTERISSPRRRQAALWALTKPPFFFSVLQSLCNVPDAYLASSPVFQRAGINKTQTLGTAEWSAGG